MKTLYLLSVVSCIVSAALAGVEEPAAGGIGVNILHVNPLQLELDLKDYDTAVVFYYVDYCRVCNKLQEVYARASYQLELQLRQQQQAAVSSGAAVKKRVFAAVNCGTNYQGCIRTSVRRVPVFKQVRNFGRDVEQLHLRFVTFQKLLDAINTD